MAVGGADELLQEHPMIAERLAVTTIQLPVKRGSSGGPRVVIAILSQLGAEECYVKFNDPTLTHALARDSDTTTAIVSLRKSIVSLHAFDKLASQPKAFHEYVMPALGAANFCDNTKSRPL